MRRFPLLRSVTLRALLIVALVGVGLPVRAQGADSAKLGEEQLEQLVAPIALYPDSLLAQVLMASTYPLEVVEAARWVKAHPDLEGQALEDALGSQSWDASVKSLTAFPQTLEMMNDKLDWTTQLGDAFLAQQAEVMNAVQVLREKAKAEGNLESNQQQTVTVEQTPTGNQSQTIVIQPANPQVVYVPTYNPTVIYGTWPYPTYPPFYWYPPGYAAVSSMISFGVGMAVGSALWGGCNWGRSDVDINVNRYNSFNKTNITNTSWSHDGSHRRGVKYGNADVQNRYGARQAQNAKSRESFRGRAEQGRQQIARGDADRFKGKAGGAAGARPGSKLGAAGRGGGQRGPGVARGGAFQGTGNGREVRRESNRGRTSRAQAASRAGGGFGGGGRGGFGGGGGGGRGGFGGGGGRGAGRRG